MNMPVMSQSRAVPPCFSLAQWWGVILLFSLLVLLPGRVLAAVPDIPLAGAYIEAEDYTAMGVANPWNWEIQSGLSGFQGTGYLYTTVGGTGTVQNGSRIDFPVNFTSSGIYQMWLRARDASPSGNGDSTFWGIDGVVIGALTEANAGRWEWTTRLQNGTNTASITAGNHVINLWPREAGQHTDSIFIIGSGQPLPTNIFEGSTDGVPTAHAALDFSTVGPGAFFITIPDSQLINGGPITLLDTSGGGTPTFQQLEYQTDLSGLQYRALGGQADGFPGFSLDSKWNKTDIGGDTTVAPTVNDGSLVLLGAGANIWSTRDFCSYLYQSGISGDFTIDIDVNSFSGPNTFSKAGIMVRQSLTNNSANVSALVTQSDGARMQYRATSGGTTVKATATNGIVAPEWLRLVRSGNNFTTSTSSDGLVWTALGGAVTVSMTDPVYVGLVVTSNVTGNAATASFENFHFMPAATSGMSTAWNTVSGSIDSTDWADGVYGLALNSGTTIQTNVFDYSSCVDAPASTISIPATQTVGGSSVSMSALFNHTGNVANFNYQIDGSSVNSPWNSLSYGTVDPGEVVSLHISGTDPDCGGKLISATQNITVDNFSCSDSTPSSLNILTGQTTGGSTVDLTAMVSSTGNVAGLSYKINGVTVVTPAAWVSTGYGLATPESVSLEVSGTDPDCTATITAVNTIEIDNTCTRNPPSISFDKDINYVGAGRSIPYQVTIRNEDSQNCSASTFNVAITVDSVNSNFSASAFNPVGSNLNLLLAGREAATFELSVTAPSGATEWASKLNTLEITSVEDPDAVHNASKTTGSVTTKVFLVSPITHNSVSTHSTKWGGSWGTSETVASAGIDSKYGNFDCLICHEKGGPNVKWMRGQIKLPDATWGTGATTEDLPITFLDARENGDWGHDDPLGDGSGRTSSTSPCEVCHSITDYHRYNTNADPVDPPEGVVGAQIITPGETHFPDRDCTDCHRHSLGFTASCIGCHGDPPLDATIGGPNGLADIPDTTGSVTPGTHYKHVVVLGYDCNYCHAGWREVGEMPKTEPNSGLAQINHTFAVFDSVEPAATAGQYTGQDGVNYQPVTDLISRSIQDANGTVLPGKGTLTCENIYCHGGTDNMGGINPQWNGNITCNSCHGTSATNTPPGYSHTTHVAQMGLACTLCHGLFTGVGSNGHVNGSVHVDLSELRSSIPNSGTALYNGVSGTVDGAKWDSGKLAPSDLDVTDGSDLYGTCSNVSCHYGTTTPVWNNNSQVATCTICHNDGTDDGTLDHSAIASGNHAKHMDSTRLMASTFIDKCQSCHGGGSNTGDHAGHVNFSIDFDSSLTWNNGSRDCTNSCHDGNYSAGLWDSPVDLECDACHKSPYIGPTVVDPSGGGAGLNVAGYGSHLKVAKTDNLAAVSWSTQCGTCHTYHTATGGIAVPLPSTSWDDPGTGAVETDDLRQRLGLEFPISGAIHLKPYSGSTTEAETCWNCHAANSVSEWNGLAYDGYSVSSSNWVSASFNAPGVLIPTRSTASIHTANPSVTNSSVASNVDGSGNISASSTLEAVSGIRCSYCHDVHDMNRALTDVAAGTVESTTGTPFLRGTWLPNPYPLERPPQSGDTFSSNNWGQKDRSGGTTVHLPRLFATSTGSAKVGGFFIDQNSGWPTRNGDGSYKTVEETAGICQLCHTGSVDTMDYYTASSLWNGAANGHKNSTLDGSGGAGNNIFDGRQNASGGTAYMHAQGASTTWRSEWGDSLNRKNRMPASDAIKNDSPQKPAKGGYAPPVNTGWYGPTEGNIARASQYSTWYGTGIGNDGDGNTPNRAHNFSCSKCHTPHASGLPALLITNCLDLQIGASSNDGSRWAPTMRNGNGADITVGPKASDSWARDVQGSCHRKDGNTTGWNNLAEDQ